MILVKDDFYLGIFLREILGRFFDSNFVFPERVFEKAVLEWTRGVIDLCF